MLNITQCKSTCVVAPTLEKTDCLEKFVAKVSHKHVALAVYFAFTLCPVHLKPAPLGFQSGACAAPPAGEAMQSGSFLQLWLIILLYDEPFTKQSVLLCYLSPL